MTLLKNYLKTGGYELKQTSKDAYYSLDDTRSARQRAQILKLIEQYGPQTHEEIIEKMGGEQYLSASGVRARCAELCSHKYGNKLRDSGEKKKSKFNKAMILWELNTPTKQGELF